MLKRIHVAAVGAAALLAAGTVAAQDGWQFVGGEAGWVLAPQSNILASEKRIAMPSVQPNGEASVDGWQFVGGEAGWTLAAHRYEFQGGKLTMIHEPWCVASHDLPAPSKSPLPGQEHQWNLYLGA